MPQVEVIPVNTWQGKLNEAKGLLEKVRAAGKPEASAEDRAKIIDWVKEARQLQSEAVALQDAETLMGQVAADLEMKGNPAGQDARKSKYNGWNEFLISAYKRGRHPDYRDPRLVSMDDFDPEDRKGINIDPELKDLVEGVGQSGGFLVPAEFQAQLMAAMVNNSIVRSRATKVRMSRRQLQIPVLDQTQTDTGVPHWFGGLQAYWQAEATSKTQSDPKFRLIDLVAHKLIMYTRASDELLSDAAVSLEDFLTGPMGFAGAIAWMEDYAFLNGTGAGQPLGVINSPATITVNRVDQDNVTYDDLVNMIEKFMPSGNGVWVLSQSVMSNLLLMTGPTGNPSYLWGNATTGRPNTLLGFPVEWSEKIPRITTTSVADVGLYDFKYYVIGDRQATSVESTKFDQWRMDLTSWRAVHRVDGQPWLSAPLTYQDGTTQISPFVILGAKST